MKSDCYIVGFLDASGIDRYVCVFADLRPARDLFRALAAADVRPFLFHSFYSPSKNE